MKYIKTYDSIRNQELENSEDMLIQAAKKGSHSKIKNLIKSGENVNQRNADGKFALIEACSNQFLLIVKTLLENGADVNLSDYLGNTAIMYSRTNKIIDLLLKYGADVNAQNNSGESALMYQSHFNSSDFIIELIKKFSNYGLDLDLVDNNGKNFYEKILNYSRLEDLIKYIDINYPKYREKVQFDLDIKQFNL